MLIWRVGGGADGVPHHQTVLERIGRGMHPIVALWIEPDGAVTSHRDSALGPVRDLAAELTATDSRLRLASDDTWEFE
jgi:hypothetical protein